MRKIYIDLDGGKKLDLGALDLLASKNFRLRSVDKNQYQVRINVGLNDDDKSYGLGSFYLDKLKPSSNGYSYLECSLQREGRRLVLVIKNDRRTVCRESFPVQPRRILIRNVLLAFAGLLLAGAITVFLLTFDFSSFALKSPSATSSSVVSTFREESVPPVSSAKGITESDGSGRNSTVVKTQSEESNVPLPETTSESLEAMEEQSPIHEESASASEPVQQNLQESLPSESATIEIVPPSQSPDLSLIDSKDLVLHFTPNSSLLSDDAIDSLKNVLSFLLDYPDLRVNIIGHCAIAGTEAGRKEISVERAVNVERWLRREGWNPIVPPQVKGEAGNYPLTRDPENQEINRRVEIHLSE